MKTDTLKWLPTKIFFLIAVSLFIAENSNAQISFNQKKLQGASISTPTSLQFGPDGRLYVSEKQGRIKAFTVIKDGNGNYVVTNTEIINLVKNIPNHNDDGTPSPENSRQVTGFYVTGTAISPIIYLASGDPRMGAGTMGDINLGTNSGVVSKLTKTPSGWTKIDLVRGLPHSEENHATNGLAYDKAHNRLLVAVGGMTNAGSPSNSFTMISEYALSAAIISIDLTAVEAMPTKDAAGLNPYKYDIPTLDDPTRANNPDGTDINDPFGGNDGLNMAKIVAGGPVQVFASGFRNPYDIIITKDGGIYTIDNGANPTWGGYPENEGSDGTVTNNYVPGEPGSSSGGPGYEAVNNRDALHYIGNVNSYVPGSYYAGHPDPIRANPAGAGLYTYDGSAGTGTGIWRTSTSDPNYPLPQDWPPVPVSMANPVEGDFQQPGSSSSRAILTFSSSTNGLCMYTASNFNGAMKGDILAASWDGYISWAKMNDAGNASLNTKGDEKLDTDEKFATGFGTNGKPLDIIAQGDDDPFPGTVWVAAFGEGYIGIYEPDETNVVCAGTYSTSLDEDNDGYTNADEIDNTTNPCSGSSKPADNDQDAISDLNDTDDDNDGIVDVKDYFAIDKDNGMTTNIPVHYDLFNEDPGIGFFGVGFTGLMCNGVSDYLQQYNINDIVAGGAAGAVTISSISAGDALNGSNNQMNGFQFGVNVNQKTTPFIISARMTGPFFNNKIPKDAQSQGIYLGAGDQDNYLKFVINANGGSGGFEIGYEEAGVMSSNQYPISKMPASNLELRFLVDPGAAVVTTQYAIDGDPFVTIGNEIPLTGNMRAALQGNQALAIGMLATSRASSTPFNATWDSFKIDYATSTAIIASTENSNYKVYPNPTFSQLFIETTLAKPATKMEIIDASGRIVKKLQIKTLSQTGTSINISDLSAGIYYLKIMEKDNNTVLFKVVKK